MRRDEFMGSKCQSVYTEFVAITSNNKWRTKNNLHSTGKSVCFLSNYFQILTTVLLPSRDWMRTLLSTAVSISSKMTGQNQFMKMQTCNLTVCNIFILGYIVIRKLVCPNMQGPSQMATLLPICNT